MARTAVRGVHELEGDVVLAPERYDPRRQALRTAAPLGAPLRQLVAVVRQTVDPRRQRGGPYLILDTSDAREGLVVPARRPTTVLAGGSSKKRVAPNDVIISRLRPYLRQVAWVDAVLSGGNDVELLCSTEFFVLRSRDGASIAFLVPLLLSAPVQAVLAAAQEGGHHPRFNEATLLDLPVPHELLERRNETSRSVERAVGLYRQSERLLREATAAAAESLAGVSL